MLDCNINNLFDTLEAIQLMDDCEFEKRLEFENNGYILKRDKNNNVSITVKKKVVFSIGHA